MFVLGIDPGLTRCGFGVVSRSDTGVIDFVRTGIFATSPQAHLSDRLSEMHGDISDLIAEVHPDAIAVERVLFQRNTSTAMSVAQVSGLVHAVAATHSIPVVEYSPTEVKNIVTGDGRADKHAIAVMVTKLLGLSKVPQPADAADALAIALAHAYSFGSDKKSDSAIYNGGNLHNAIADSILATAKKIERPKQEIPLPQRRRRGLVR